MTAATAPTLDAEASADLDAERTRHRAAVGALALVDDPSAVAGECDAHLDRVEEIMLAFTRRRRPPAAAACLRRP